MGRAKYVCFRFFIVPIDQHLFAKPVSHDEKMKMLGKAFFKRHDYTLPTGGEFAIRITYSEGNYAYGKLSRKQYYDLHEKGPDDIKETTVEDWPFLEFLCDTTEHKQLLVIQYNSRIIPKISTISHVLTEIVNIGMFSYGYSVSFQPLVSETSFWEYVGQSEGIFRLSFNLQSPNLFGADQKANESLKKLQEVFNNTETRITLANQGGDLKIPKDIVETYRDYADKGGGNWELVTKRKNKKRKIKSSDKSIKVTVEFDETEDRKHILHEALKRFMGLL